MRNSILKDSCQLVYQYPRIGHTNEQCNPTSGTSSTTTAPPNKRKFEVNGCSKVNRDNACKLKLLRG